MIRVVFRIAAAFSAAAPLPPGRPGSRRGITSFTSSSQKLALALVLAVGGLTLQPAISGAVPHAVEAVTFATGQLTVERVGEATGPELHEVVVRYPGAIANPAGSPDLARTLVWVEIPAGTRAVGLAAEPVGIEELGRVWVRPVPPDVRPGDEEPEAAADPAIYEAGGMYPPAWAELGPQGSMRGHRVVSILVSPVRWDLSTGRLVRVSAVRLTLELESGEAGDMVTRHRVVKEIEEKFEAAAGRTIRGFEPATVTGTLGVTGADGAPRVGDGPAGPGPFQPTFRPTTDGSAVEYVIVTSDALADEFERLATWKTQKGVQAVVRTVEWIDQTYPNGVDRAERIRFFIRDAYQNWGTLFVLLGGDTDVVPQRYGETTFYLANGESIPADLYYACLEGNWNANGNARFGEGQTGANGLADEADLLFEVSVGRAPVSTIDQVATFCDKTLLYDMTTPEGPRYPASIVVLAERLFPATHGADIAEQALALVPPWVTIERIYEESDSYPGSIELTRQSALDSINGGFGIVHHVGHGFRNTMSVGSGTLNNADADNLMNAPRNSVVFAINCSSVSIDFNSIGERFVKNPNGGSIAYLGTSRLAFVTPSSIYQNDWYEKVFVDSVTTIGLATDMARSSLLPAAPFDGSSRWNLMATILLGDPEVDIYTNDVIPMQVAHPASVPVGSPPITVTVTSQGSLVDSATVTLWRQGEVYVRAETAADGTASLPITADTPGELVLTVHRTYYRPYVFTLPVTAASGPYLHVQSTVVDDDGNGASSGDGDGFPDAGETIELTVILKNGGTAQVTAAGGVLTADDPEGALTIIQNTVSYGTLAPGGSSGGSGPFVIAIAPEAPVAYQPILTITASGNEGGPWEDPIALPIRRPYLEHYAHEVDDALPRGNGNGLIENGEQIYYRVTLRNTGQDGASAVDGKLRALDISTRLPHPQVSVEDSLSSFGAIAQGGQATGDRFVFTLDPLADPGTVLLEVTLTDALGPVDLQFVDVQDPAPPDSFTAFGTPSSIRIHWKPSPSRDVKGYDISRSISAGGPFERINLYTIDGSSAYEDLNLLPLTRYYYRVVARDSSYNTSQFTDTFSGVTSPPFTPGWPQELGQTSSSSPIVADIDGGPHNEILCGAEMQYAWHGDGSEVVDGDQDPRTNGPFSLYGWSVSTTGFAATPAAGDLNASGELQIMNVGFTRDTLYVWDNQGEVLPGWPKGVSSDVNFGSPLLADLDLDGDLEVVLWTGQNNRLYVWHHDGSQIFQAQLPGGPLTYNYSSPAVADLAGDERLEFLVAINYSPENEGAVHAFDLNGSPVPGWPFLTGGAENPSQITGSIAVADLDHNGTDEVVIACERDGGSIYVLNSDATVASGWPKLAPCYTEQARTSSPSIADVDGDGFLDIVFPDTSGQLWVWDRFGTVLSGFPVTYYPNPSSQTTQSTASIGDIDGDGMMEIVFGDEKGKVHAYNHDGTLTDGFPIQVGGEVRGTPALWDLDRDNLIEVAVVCFDANVYVWDLPYEFNPILLPWPFFRHDTRNTGRYSTPVQQIGIGEPGPVPVPVAAAFHPVQPNPFNPSATLAFDVPGSRESLMPVTLQIYDVNGRLVRKLVEGPVAAGRQTATWDGRSTDGARLGSGVYFARITIGDFSATRKMTMIR